MMRPLRWGMLAVVVLASRAWAEPAVVNGPPLVNRDGTVAFVVQGEFRPSIESARESAMRTAQDRIRDYLERQQPPVRHVPSIETIRREMNPRSFAPEEEAILNQTDRMYKMSMEVTLTPKLLRSFRERDHVQIGMFALAGLLSMLGIAYLVCRLDEWQPGRRGRWFVISVGVLLALVAAVWRVTGY